MKWLSGSIPGRFRGMRSVIRIEGLVHCCHVACLGIAYVTHMLHWTIILNLVTSMLNSIANRTSKVFRSGEVQTANLMYETCYNGPETLDV